MSTTPQYTPRTYQAGQRASADDLTRHGMETARLARLSGNGLEITSDGTGTGLSIPEGLELVFGTITANGTGANDRAHSWIEQTPSGFGDFDDTALGITGDVALTPMLNPFYEINDEILEVGTRIIAWKGATRVESGQLVQEWEGQVGVGAAAGGYGYGTTPIVGDVVCARATADVTISSGTPADITGCLITLDLITESKLAINATFDFDYALTSLASPRFEGQLYIDDVLQAGVVEFLPSNTSASAVNDRKTVGQDWCYTLPEGHHVLKLKALRATGTSNAIVRLANTALLITFFSREPDGNSAVVRVTSLTEDADGYLPGFVQSYDVPTKVFSDSTPCLVKKLI